ncbi:MAG: hypothetical protein Q7S65_02515 [Nanoarchaeota archaeon]|nr:hypothetical protein [Nanoarchaeota archaeon]
MTATAMAPSLDAIYQAYRAKTLSPDVPQTSVFAAIHNHESPNAAWCYALAEGELELLTALWRPASLGLQIGEGNTYFVVAEGTVRLAPNDKRAALMEQMDELARTPGDHLAVAHTYNAHGYMREALEHYQEASAWKSGLEVAVRLGERDQIRTHGLNLVKSVVDPKNIADLVFAAERLEGASYFAEAAGAYDLAGKPVDRLRARAERYVDAGNLAQAILLYTQNIDIIERAGAEAHRKNRKTRFCTSDCARYEAWETSHVLNREGSKLRIKRFDELANAVDALARQYQKRKDTPPPRWWRIARLVLPDHITR